MILANATNRRYEAEENVLDWAKSLFLADQGGAPEDACADQLVGLMEGIEELIDAEAEWGDTIGEFAWLGEDLPACG